MLEPTGTPLNGRHLMSPLIAFGIAFVVVVTISLILPSVIDWYAYRPSNYARK
jgi:hypothetical protein